jgi:hypothetical protein
MKQIIKAASTTSTVHQWLASSTSAQILHVFDHACNLCNERREIVSIVTQEIGPGPFNIVIESDVRFAEELSLASPIFTSIEQLSLGAITIHIIDAELWDACPDWRALHAKRDSIRRQVSQVSEAVVQVSNRRGASQADTFSSSLAASIAAADIASCIHAAQKLAGLGQGLTPAGDDFLMGAVYAAWIIHRHEVAECIAAEIAKVATPLTTSLSAAWLRAAAKGEAGILWHKLFDALISGNETAIDTRTSNILSIGATSGIDALAGFINTFTAYTEIENRHVIPEFFRRQRP